MLRHLLSTILLFTAGCISVYAQTGQGALKGKILDANSKEPVPFANVVVELNGVLQAGATSDFNGEFMIKPITPGVYTVKSSYMGYKSVQINGVQITADKIQFLDIKMSENVEMLKEVEVVEYIVPIFEKDNTVTSTTVTKDDLVKMAARSATDIAATVGGVYSQDDGSNGLNVRGSRDDANYVFIDGIKVRGSSNLPQSAIEEVSVIVGGLPAMYGDVTGGIISITTRGPSSTYFGSAEYVTSGFKIGDNMYGLDAFGHNMGEISLSGPILMRKDSTGKKTKPLVGFFASANFTSDIDPRPSAIGTWKVKDDVLDNMKRNPLRYAVGDNTGTNQEAEFLRLNSFEKTRTRMNVARNGIVLNGKIDVATGNNTNLTFGGSYEWRKFNESPYQYQLFNWENNPEVTQSTWRVFGRFTQRFNNAPMDETGKSASTIKNAYYSVQVDYNQDNYLRQNPNHGDDFFAYGHYGEFKRFQERTYQTRFDTIYDSSGEIEYAGLGNFQETFTDTLIGFRPSTSNPEAAAFTSNYYRLYGWQGYDENGNPVFDREAASIPGGTSPEDQNFFLRRLENVRSNGGLVNGDLAFQPRDVYNIWRNHALQWGSYDVRNSSQFRVSALGSADIKNHAFSMGFEYEQRTDRGFSLNPVGLWNIGNLRVNSHLQNLDRRNAEVEYTGTLPTVNYERLNASPGEYRGEAGEDAQSFIDYNVRKSLGLNPDGNDFVDFHSLSPQQLKLDYFSANELLNNGQELVTYWGYDPYGNKTSGNPSIEDFFNATDENGNFTRPIGAFTPNYIAGWVQDKFAFDDLIFNVGLRVDRYDANQSVLRDPFVLFPTVKAGEVRAREIAEEMGNYRIPGNIGDDYVVYVDNVQNASRIVGYRKDDRWFNNEGIEIQDPRVLRGASGIAPLLVTPDKTESTDITSASFVDYTPQVNFMPRIAFSFPISEDAVFFAHYDVLTKRPLSNRLNPLDYYFLNTRTASNIILNPDLRPEKTIDYAIGFKQKLTNSSSMSIEAFYREMRDQIQLLGVAEAYPKTYTTFGNLDFGTVKGLTFSYDMRRTGNVSLRAAYTLQFAEGTGSNAESAINLVRAGKQNLRTTTPLNYDQRHTIVATMDYRYGSGKSYNGPVIKDKQILKNTGANFQFNLGSGTPYSKQSIVTGTRLISGAASPILDGSINGSRLPWQYRIDMRLDRDIDVTVGQGKRPVRINVYAQVLNVFNALNIINVYRATGNPDDDGYLDSPIYDNDIAAQVDPMAFRDMYAMSMTDFRYFTLPRRTRLGVLVTF